MLKKIFGSKVSEPHKKNDWISLTNLNQLEEINTSEKLVVIFKHSTRCGISSMVLRKFERNFAIEDNEVRMYFLDLIAFRNISNQIAEDYGVEHQSPQLIVIKNGKEIAHNSHSGIHTIHLSEFI